MFGIAGFPFKVHFADASDPRENSVHDGRFIYPRGRLQPKLHQQADIDMADTTRRSFESGGLRHSAVGNELAASDYTASLLLGRFDE